MFTSALRRVWRSAGVCGSVPVYGRNVGRAISPAAWGVRHRKVSGTMQASFPTKHRARLCRVCGISPTQAGNAPLRLRLTAHPPSGLRCPHRTARAEARLCSATVKPAPSRFLRCRRRSTPQPLTGEALGELPTGRLPCKGNCRRQPTEGCGILPCEYPSGPPQASPAGVNARPTMQGRRAAGPGASGMAGDDGRGAPLSHA